MVNALLNYPGSKWGMAAEIISMMPSHRSYLEPFFGSGAVLFSKPPSAIETVNDIDGDIVNFFTVLREQSEELSRLIALTPYARSVYDDAHSNRGTDPLDRAYRFAIRNKMGYGIKTYSKTGFKIDVAGREGCYASLGWLNMPEKITQMCKRLKHVQIENRPAVELIRRFNFENVLIYADPPYLMSTRGGKQYRHEMTEQDHWELLVALRQHKGPVILSGYPSAMYDGELKGWDRVEKKAYNQNAEPETEVLWCNFSCGQTRIAGF